MSPHRARVGLLGGFAVLLVVPGCERGTTPATAETSAPARDPAPPAPAAFAADLPPAAATLADEPRFVEPPADDTDAAALARAAEQLRAGDDVGALLRDPAYLPLHAHPTFRALIREHARAAPVTIVTPAEPGAPILARGRMRDARGRPLRDLLVYVYQTDARGWYAAEAPHIAGMAGDQRHARLFGYVRTGPDGAFEVRTIRPVGYPGTEFPAHIHVEVFRGEQNLLVTELLFEDDPRLTPEARKRSLDAGYVIAPPEPGPDGLTVYSAAFTIERS